MVGACCIWTKLPSMTRSDAFDFAVAVLLHSVWLGPDRPTGEPPFVPGYTVSKVSKCMIIESYHAGWRMPLILSENRTEDIFNLLLVQRYRNHSEQIRVPLGPIPLHPKDISVTGSREVYWRACSVSQISVNLGSRWKQMEVMVNPQEWWGKVDAVQGKHMVNMSKMLRAKFEMPWDASVVSESGWSCSCSPAPDAWVAPMHRFQVLGTLIVSPLKGSLHCSLHCSLLCPRISKQLDRIWPEHFFGTKHRAGYFGH